MNYEFRVWKDQDKMPDSFEAEEAKSRLLNIKRDIELKALVDNAEERFANPDILIDSDGAAQSPITSADILFELAKVKNPYAPDDDDDDDDDEDAKTIVRTVKMHIKGNLYLPLNPNAVGEAVAGLVGSKGDENKLRDTLLLSQWAQEEEPVVANAEPGYYRGVLLSVLTKAGDFRLVSANNMYVIPRASSGRSSSSWRRRSMSIVRFRSTA